MNQGVIINVVNMYNQKSYSMGSRMLPPPGLQIRGVSRGKSSGGLLPPTNVKHLIGKKQKEF